jgi:hypothetical protein
VFEVLLRRFLVVPHFAVLGRQALPWQQSWVRKAMSSSIVPNSAKYRNIASDTLQPYFNPGVCLQSPPLKRQGIWLC